MKVYPNDDPDSAAAKSSRLQSRRNNDNNNLQARHLQRGPSRRKGDATTSLAPSYQPGGENFVTKYR